jgi:DNA-binding CsgD family transcriptional regulator
VTAPVAPGLSRRDARIAEMLDKGLSVDRVAEQGVYHGTRTAPAWTRADVERLAASRRRTEKQPEAAPASERACRCQRATVPWTAPQLHGRPSTVVLTVRQAAILDGLCEALDAPAICARLGITDGTLRSHVKALLAEFGAADRAQLVALAMSDRFVIEIADGRATSAPSTESTGGRA